LSSTRVSYKNLPLLIKPQIFRSVRSSIRLFFSYQICEHDIFKKNEPILTPMAHVVQGQGHETITNFGGQEIKGQSHRRPKVDLEAWHKHHYVSL